MREEETERDCVCVVKILITSDTQNILEIVKSWINNNAIIGNGKRRAQIWSIALFLLDIFSASSVLLLDLKAFIPFHHFFSSVSVHFVTVYVSVCVHKLLFDWFMFWNCFFRNNVAAHIYAMCAEYRINQMKPHTAIKKGKEKCVAIEREQKISSSWTDGKVTERAQYI